MNIPAPCCICPPGCQGLDGKPPCSLYCSVCTHGCPAMGVESCCRERQRLGRLTDDEKRRLAAWAPDDVLSAAVRWALEQHWRHEDQLDSLRYAMSALSTAAPPTPAS